jgi:hypothetical protein
VTFDVDELEAAYANVADPRAMRRRRGNPRQEAREAPFHCGVSLVSLFQIRTALAGAEPPAEDQEGLTGEEDEDEGANEEGAIDEPSVFADDAAVGHPLSIESPAPAYLWKKGLEGLHRVAAATPGADPVLIEPGVAS